MTKVNILLANVVALSGLLGGAALVHNVYKPDLVRIELMRCKTRSN